MGFKDIIKNAVAKVEGVFSGSKPQMPALDLVEELDRSWSGRARAGPIHYSSLDASVRRRNASGLRDGSNRGIRVSNNSDTSTNPNTSLSIYPEGHDPLHQPSSLASISRSSSIPRNISTAGQQPPATKTHPSNAQRDSASSLETMKTSVTSPPGNTVVLDNSGSGNGRPRASEPVEINPSGRFSRFTSPFTNTATAAEKQQRSSSSKGAATSSSNSTQDTSNRGGAASSKPRAIMEPQGGLAQALSREPSVRNGQVCSPCSDDVDVVASPSMASWGKRVKQFKTPTSASTGVGNDSARSSINLTRGNSTVVGVGVGVGGAEDQAGLDQISVDDSTTTQGVVVGKGVASEEVVAKLESLQLATDGVTHSSQTSQEEQRQREEEFSCADNQGVIVVDPTLAVDWAAAPDEATTGSGSGSGTREEPSLMTNDKKSRRQSKEDGVNTADADGEKTLLLPPPPPPSTTTDEISHSVSERTASKSFTEEPTFRVYAREEGEEELPPPPPPSETSSSGGRDWNRRFVRRWKAVRQRARLQALGMRTIWNLDSPATGGVHHPPELLTNELPRPDALYTLNNQNKHRRSAQSAVPAEQGKSGTSGSSIVNRDPSLATLLLGEVAEVC